VAQSVHRRRQRIVDEFHRQIVRTNIVELADIGMIQRRDGVHFVLEALRESGLGN